MTTLPAEDLRVTPTGQVRVDLPGRSLVEIVREDYRARKRPAAPSLADRYRGDGYPGIRDWTLVPATGAPPGPGPIAWEKAGSSEVADDRRSTAIASTTAAVSSCLLLHLRPVEEARPPHGRARSASPASIRPEDWPEVESALARGDAVVSFDARGLGETRMVYKAVSIDDPELAKLDDEAAYVSPISGVLANHVYNALLTGRPYFFQLLDDTEIACRFAREVLGSPALAVDGPRRIPPLGGGGRVRLAAGGARPSRCPAMRPSPGPRPSRRDASSGRSPISCRAGPTSG